MQTFALIVVLVVSVALSGCVALPLMAPAAMSAGGDLVKAGTVRTFGGATQRTFSVSLSELYAATRQTLDRLGFGPPEEHSKDERVILYAYAIDRTIRIDLMPITGEMTQMRVFVRKNSLGKDVATASELVTQTERVLNPPPTERAAQRKPGDRRTTAR
jgi:hypothetical protein